MSAGTLAIIIVLVVVIVVLVVVLSVLQTRSSSSCASGQHHARDVCSNEKGPGSALLSKDSNVVRGPVLEIPQPLLRGFTDDGKAVINTIWHYSDTATTSGKLRWRNDDEPGGALWCIAKAKESLEKGTPVYYASDKVMGEVFSAFPVSNKRVAVVGSATPLYEAYIHVSGGTPVTVEYRAIDNEVPWATTMTLEEAVEKPPAVDVIMSISSVEHAGLGRYGDVLDPEADMKTVRWMRSLLPDGGLLILQVPVGSPQLQWNAQRVYGRSRLRRLLSGWQVVGAFNYNTSMWSARMKDPVHEPILVMKRVADDKFQDQAFFNKDVIPATKT